MLLRTVLLLIPLTYCVHSQDQKDLPVNLLDLKDVVIEDYHGPMDAKATALLKNVQTLSFRSCNFTTFNEDFFISLENLQKITMAHCHYDRIKSELSNCCQNLREAELISSSIGIWGDEEFKKTAAMKNMERLYLLRMEVPAIHANVLAGSNLKNLEIEYSILETVEDGAFNGMEKLEVLSLRNEKLKTVPTKSLAALKNLKELNLSGNLLEKITTEDFPLMPNLEKVNLGNNPVKKIDLKGLKDKLPKLKEVDVSGIDIDPSKAEGIPLVKKQVV